MSIDIDDPRVFPAEVDPAHARVVDLAAASLAATTTARAEEIDRALAGLVVERLQSDESLRLAEAVAAAPSPAVARVLWRALIAAWTPKWRAPEATLATTLFVLPVVIIAGRERAAAEGGETGLPCVLAETARLEAILREHRALRGSESFALSAALVASDAIDVPRLSGLFIAQRLGAEAKLDLPPAPIVVAQGQQSVHLRFLVGTAFAAPDVDLLAEPGVGAWGMPLARELARQLALPDVAVLALPREPRSAPAALLHGREVQREVSAQLFASNAIRRLRASVGEPTAVVSAHRSPAAPGGGELRVSLSSPFDPRQAEGFRCPLFATDRAVDVATMLVDLLRDCRVGDVRVLRGVHPDRDPATGMLLLFKPDASQGAEPTLH